MPVYRVYLSTARPLYAIVEVEAPDERVAEQIALRESVNWEADIPEEIEVQAVVPVEQIRS